MAADYDLTIEAGATFTAQFRYKNPDQTLFDLTGFTAQAQIRVNANSASPVLVLSPTIDVASSVITVTIPAAQTSLLMGSLYVWALELHAVGSDPVIRLLEGDVYVSPEVVR